MFAAELPGCCALRILHDLDCLGGDDAWAERERKKFDTVRVRGGQVGGDNCTATIVTLSDDGGRAFLNKQVAFLKKRGYKLLGSWKGIYCQTIYLYGSKEFKMPRRTK